MPLELYLVHCGTGLGCFNNHHPFSVQKFKCGTCLCDFLDRSDSCMFSWCLWNRAELCESNLSILLLSEYTGNLWKISNSALVSFSDPEILCREMLIRNGSGWVPWQGTGRTWQLAGWPDLFCYWRLCPGSTEKGKRRGLQTDKIPVNTLRIKQIYLLMPELCVEGVGDLDETFGFVMNGWSLNQWDKE